MKKLIPLFGFSLSLMLSACKKDTPVTKTDLLTAGAWRIVAMTANPGIRDANGVVVTDLLALEPACFKDNLTRYEKPNTLTFDEGPTKCDPSSTQTTQHTWAFNADETVINAVISGDKVDFTLLELTDSRLRYSYTEGAGAGGHTVTIVFNKK
ncbi:hypothetical protein [Hymenobacter cellulosivorans]|uniref:Lipocalin-like domain-containing protein n=1 Tax=Hymenobacter cellulosivorans TaxID=2932249 RepID=A0ABY4F2D5_9BACT|nr:hypothetical protein [Hymenobacter cellulosivorans]UOQ50715.1 hypothetical protein MUN80_13195 [Hymenobacter cellulosivorans]